MPAFVSQGLESSSPAEVVTTHSQLQYPHIYDEEGFSIDIVPSTKFYQSYDREGNHIIYSPTHEQCEYWTRRWLKAKQDGGWTDTLVLNSGVVGGKL
jgi:hypothetical protein